MLAPKSIELSRRLANNRPKQSIQSGHHYSYIYISPASENVIDECFNHLLAKQKKSDFSDSEITFPISCNMKLKKPDKSGLTEWRHRDLNPGHYGYEPYALAS